MKLKSIVLFLSLSLLLSCGTPQGKVKNFGNLEVYYTKEIQMEYVDGIGHFFEKNGLIHPEQTHSVKLTSNSESFILKMILNPDLDSIPEDKLKEIIYLERAIDTTVFKNRNFAIEITDNYFNPLNTQ